MDTLYYIFSQLSSQRIPGYRACYAELSKVDIRNDYFVLHIEIEVFLLRRFHRLMLCHEIRRGMFRRGFKCHQKLNISVVSNFS